MHSFSESERAAGRAAFDSNPEIGIGALAQVIKRAKEAAKELREEFRRDLGAQSDLIRSRPGELDFGLDRLFPHPFNTRLVSPRDNDIVALAKAIERDGQLEPLTAVRSTDGLTEALVIDGVRRLTALRRLGWPTAKVVLVEWHPTEVAAFIQARDRLQKRLSAYEFALHIDAIMASYPNEAACAAALGMKPDTFSKAGAPSHVPDCVFERIADPREITVKDAAALRALWRRDPYFVQAKASEIESGSSAKHVFAKIMGVRASNAFTISRVELEQALQQAAQDGQAIPDALAIIFINLLEQQQ